MPKLDLKQTSMRYVWASLVQREEMFEVKQRWAFSCKIIYTKWIPSSRISQIEEEHRKAPTAEQEVTREYLEVILELGKEGCKLATKTTKREWLTSPNLYKERRSRELHLCRYNYRRFKCFNYRSPKKYIGCSCP